MSVSLFFALALINLPQSISTTSTERPLKSLAHSLSLI